MFSLPPYMKFVGHARIILLRKCINKGPFIYLYKFYRNKNMIKLPLTYDCVFCNWITVGSMPKRWIELVLLWNLQFFLVLFLIFQNRKRNCNVSILIYCWYKWDSYYFVKLNQNNVTNSKIKPSQEENWPGIPRIKKGLEIPRYLIIEGSILTLALRNFPPNYRILRIWFPVTTNYLQT